MKRRLLAFIGMCCMELLATGLASAANTALPQDHRVAIVVGNNVGVTGDEPLHYAEADARRMRQLLIDAGGVSPERAYLLLGRDAAALRRAISEATGRIAELAAHGPTTLIVYVSCHADEKSLHLAGTKLTIEELRALLNAIEVDLCLTIVDACRTRVQTRHKGGRPGPEIAVVLDKGTQVSGKVFLNATGPGEPAQEWTYLRGALFTHHLMTALRGVADVDRDGRVTLAEAYSYAFRTTVAQTATTTHPQHPSFDFNLQGFGDWAFTRPGELGSRLILGQGLAGTIWIADQKNQLVAEVAKTADEVVAVAVDPGWYRVVLPDGVNALVADVNLGWRNERTLIPDEFIAVPLNETTLKSPEPIVLRPWRVELGYTLASGSLAGLVRRHFVALNARYAKRRWFAGVGLGAAPGQFRGNALTVHQWEWRLEIEGGMGFPIHIFWLGGGIAGSVALVRQKVEYDNAERMNQLAGGPAPLHYGAVYGISALGLASVSFTSRLWLTLRLHLGTERLKMDDQRIEHPLVGRVGLQLGVSF